MLEPMQLVKIETDQDRVWRDADYGWCDERLWVGLNEVSQSDSEGNERLVYRLEYEYPGRDMIHTKLQCTEHLAMLTLAMHIVQLYNTRRKRCPPELGVDAIVHIFGGLAGEIGEPVDTVEPWGTPKGSDEWKDVKIYDISMEKLTEYIGEVEG